MSERSHPDPRSLVLGPDDDPVAGRVVWDAPHSLWNGFMLVGALAFAPFTASPSSIAVFLLLTGGLLLVGHSVGFHRRLIHGSFECPLWLERVLVWCGTLVGMSGPFWMMHAHDLRDWAQRRADCHPALAHKADVWTDWLWTMHCRLELDRAPRFAPPERIARDPFYRWLERTWMLQQLPLALLLYWGGGWSWIVWGVFVRVTVSVNGHWFVGRLAHRRGPQTWRVEDAGVQAHDVPWAAIPTMGEAWHNNHHAFPGSAKMGLLPGQSDWGWVFLKALERVGLVWGLKTPADFAEDHLEPVR